MIASFRKLHLFYESRQLKKQQLISDAWEALSWCHYEMDIMNFNDKLLEVSPDAREQLNYDVQKHRIEVAFSNFEDKLEKVLMCFPEKLSPLSRYADDISCLIGSAVGISRYIENHKNCSHGGNDA
jgi:hypothetical protein